MTQTLTWVEVLNRENLIGGDIESREDGVIYRGPLSEIKDDGDLIYFVSPWCARLNTKTGEWESWHITTSLSFVNKEMVTPQDIGDGRIHFSMLFLDTCTIFPRTGNKLDAQNVRGLPKASERLLAQYPDLRFDREVAQKVYAVHSWMRMGVALTELPSGATLTEFLAKFRYDSGAEEFLWLYIQAITDEKDVHQKVY